MSTSASSATQFPKPFEKVMAFLDGGYLREAFKKKFGHDRIKYGYIAPLFIQLFNEYPGNPFQADLIRIYYYDAIVDESDPNYQSDKRYFQSIEDESLFTVRKGSLVESPKGIKQKEVDILMAVDAITKAYANQYTTGIFWVGDRDFIPLIKAVKDAGKKTIGVYFKGNISKELMRTFDRRADFTERTLRSLLKE